MSLIKEAITNGGRFVGNLLIKTSTRGVTNNGLPYYTVVFQDISGVLEAKKWDATAEDDIILTPGKVVYVEGEVINYKGKPQMKILNLLSIPQNTIDMREYIVSCPMSDDQLKKEVYGYIDQIANESMRELVKTMIKDNEEKYFTYPAAMTFHHSYRGGIAYHSLSVMKLSLAIQQRYPYLLKDYLIAGSLLHDIGKIVELSGNIGTQYTPEGKMLGHISIGASMVASYADKLKTDLEVRNILIHMVLSHHEKPEYGSPVYPQTAEAVVLHFADDIDSKMDILETALKDIKEGEYTVKLTPFDSRMFYKTHK